MQFVNSFCCIFFGYKEKLCNIFVTACKKFSIFNGLQVFTQGKKMQQYLGNVASFFCRWYFFTCSRLKNYSRFSPGAFKNTMPIFFQLKTVSLQYQPIQLFHNVFNSKHFTYFASLFVSFSVFEDVAFTPVCIFSISLLYHFNTLL